MSHTATPALIGALDAAARGWHVAPLYGVGKGRPIKGWQAAATTDPEQIRAWHDAGHPGFLIKMGRQSGVFAIDDDREKHSLECWMPPVETLHCVGQSGLGGRWLYRWPADDAPIPNSAGKIAEYIDVKGQNRATAIGDGSGYILCPGTADNYIDLDLPIAECPPELLALVRGARVPPGAPAAQEGADLNDPAVIRIRWGCPDGVDPLAHAAHLAAVAPAAVEGANAGTATLRFLRAICWGLGLDPLDETVFLKVLLPWTDRGVDLHGQPWPISDEDLTYKILQAQALEGAPYPRGALLPTAPAAALPRCPPGATALEHARNLIPQISDGALYLSICETGLALGPGAVAECLADWARHHRRGVPAAPAPAAANWSRGCLQALPLVVTKDGVFWFRRIDSEDFAWRCSERDAPLAARELLPGMWSDSPGLLPPVAKIRSACKPVGPGRRATYTCAETKYDPSTYSLCEGLRVLVQPHYDAAADAWLRALAGPKYLGLTQWLAATRQDRLGAPSQCLALIGPKSLGKSMFAHAVARMYGTNEALDIRHVLAQFNGAMADCPIWLIDEQRPKGLDSAAFRSLVVASTHRVEKKGQEKFVLHGCGRMVFAANDVAEIRLDGSKNADAVDAIADRMYLILCQPEAAAALHALRLPDGVRVDLDRIAGHMRWIQETVLPVSDGRILGAPADADTHAAVAAAEAQDTPELLELLRDALADPEAWDAAQVLPDAARVWTPRQPAPEARAQYAVFRCRGEWRVLPASLAGYLGIPAREVPAALGQMARSGRKSTRIGTRVCACLVLDESRVRSLLPPDAMADLQGAAK